MPNYYKKQNGFSYFSVPDRLLELRPKIDSFTLDLWLLLHCRIQHNQNAPRVLLTDDQIANHAMWEGRSIHETEISRARALLKKLGVLAYRKEGLAWIYFPVHPVSGVCLDPEQADLEEKKKQKQARETAVETSRVAQLEAELASLRKQLPAQSATVVTARVTHVAEDFDPFDTGQVDE
jgi:hypothetical protein